MVFNVSVNHPVLVVPAPLLLVLSEEAILLPERRPLWYVCSFFSVRRAEKGGVVDMSVLLGHKDKLEVAVLPSSKVALDRLRVHHQELMALLYGGLVVLDRILGE